MSYQVLARKWRPQNFREMVGQQHVLRALLTALDENRLHHAYLFTGTRGVGKTTIARIFAKCLNCDTGVTSSPCGECRSCTEIVEGRHVDLIEVDAASRTKVEDTRDLLDNVQYAPTRGRYKIYLIDEVHMLSGHSFNALLKTLEEPPPHVKFLFATTDPQKLPVTILSRCLQFNLKRMPVDMISGHLANVLGEEKIEHNEAALRIIARAADGSMRDALSLTDQAIVTGGGKVLDDAVQDMLGMLPHEHLLALITALADNDAKALLAVVEQMAQLTTDFTMAADNLISMLHQLALQQVVPEQDGLDANLARLAERMAAADLQLYYQMALHGKRDLPLNPEPRAGFEMMLLRMLAFRLDTGVSAPANAASTAGQASAAQVAPAGSDKKKSLTHLHPTETATSAPAASTSPYATSAATQSDISGMPNAVAELDATDGVNAVAEMISAGEAVSVAAEPDALDVAITAEALNIPAGSAVAGGANTNEAPSVSATDASQVLLANADEAPSVSASDASQVLPVNANEAPSVSDAGDIDAGDVTEALQVSPVDGMPEESGVSVAVDEYADYPEALATSMPPPANQSEPPAAAVQAVVPDVAEHAVAQHAVLEEATDEFPAEAPTPDSTYTGERDDNPWHSMLPQLKLSGMAQQLAEHCLFKSQSDGKVVLLLERSGETLLTTRTEQALTEALQQHFSESVKPEFEVVATIGETPEKRRIRLRKERQAEAERSIVDDPVIQQLQQKWGGVVIPGSVKPNKDVATS